MKKAIYTVALGFIASSAMAQVSLTGANPIYTQDFDALVNTGTAGNVLGAAINGWEIGETLGGSQDDELYKVDNGAGNTGNTLSYGATGSTERALGSLRSSSLQSNFGVQFENATGTSITQMDVTFYGEQWRLGAASAVNDSLLFYYSTTATSLDTNLTVGWVKVPALTFSSLVMSGTAGALDGNAAANRELKTASITGLNIPTGSKVWIKWIDVDRIPGSDDGLAVDDLTIQFTTGTVIGPVDTFARFTSATQNVNENAGAVNVNIMQTPVNAAGSNYTVDVVLKSGNAADISNYTTQTVNFTAGTPTAPFTFTVSDNAILDGNKTVVFALRNQSAPMLIGTDSLLTVTIVDNEVAPLPFYSIAHVRGTNTDGQPDSLGVKCRVAGKVYGVNLRTNGLQFYIHDNTAGMAVFTPANTFGYVVQEGDSVVVEGEVGTFRGLAQMTFVDTIFVAGTANIPAPAITSTLLDEGTEGELIRINGLNASTIDWNNGINSGNSFTINATNGVGQYQVRIEKNTTAFSLAAPNTFFDVIGIGSQFATTSTAPFVDGYQIIPRKAADIIINVSNEEFLKDAVKVFPNPSMGEFNMVAFVNNEGEYTMSIIDMTGKTVFVKNLNLHAGNNLVSEDFSSLSSGIYHVRVIGAKGAINTQFVVK